MDLNDIVPRLQTLRKYVDDLLYDIQEAQDAKTYPYLRVHRAMDLSCEACTRHFRTGGADVHTCQQCGVYFETSGEICMHCKSGESPLNSQVQRKP